MRVRVPPVRGCTTQHMEELHNDNDNETTQRRAFTLAAAGGSQGPTTVAAGI